MTSTPTQTSGTGPLTGVRVIELGGIGPVPFAGMMLSDMGAEVIQIHRPGGESHVRILERNRRSICVNLKHPDGVDLVMRLLDQADILLEGFRPGVAERLGLGPEPCLARRSRLIYGRMTGYGQTGPYASVAGHDLNYIAVAGVLSTIGSAGGPPVPPMNIVADYGGAMLLVAGVLAALVEAGRSGIGQVVDTAMVDAAALLMAPFYDTAAKGQWGPRGTNVIDSGAHFYQAYETADGHYVAVAAIEPQYYAALLGVLGLDAATLPAQMDRDAWPWLKARFAQIFRTRTRPEWCASFDGVEACFSPVYTPAEAVEAPHNVDRGTFVTIDGVVHPAPAPRFSRTSAELPRTAPGIGQDTDAVVTGLGLTEEEVRELRAVGAIGG
ncbi:CaiB/BaiF CoA transferase family protein [Acrocarpospora catenulata]|uniref:CaiB/BaiF CoA transferase family protein n=1 Tax=Acrocarpospora catenulata TaxID=2836182 RepID=UPI001BDB5F99|nr:CaiB/BaiF CoA-transferase family protein [Acrocarpospora catenulata]